MPGEGGEHTYCWTCRALLIARYGFVLLGNRIRQGRCPECGTPIDGVEMDGIEERHASRGSPV